MYVVAGARVEVIDTKEPRRHGEQPITKVEPMKPAPPVTRNVVPSACVDNFYTGTRHKRTSALVESAL